MGGISDNGDKPNLSLVREDMERTLERIQDVLADKTRELGERIDEARLLSDERLAALAARVTFTEAQAPKNANRRKVDDGHHHNQTLEGFDGGDLQGFGYQLNAAAGITLTRSGRTLTIAADGGVSNCYDYVVMDCYAGTEGATVTFRDSTCTAKLYSTIQAAVTDADAANDEKSFLLCGTFSEDVVFASTVTHDMYFEGHGARVAVWGRASSGEACTLDGTASIWFRRIQFRGSAAAHSVTSAGSGVKAHFEDCEFDRAVSADFGTPSSFLRCKFDRAFDVDSGHTPTGCFFYECSFTGEQTWADDLDDCYFLDCRWTSASDEIVVSSAASLTDVVFSGGTAGTSGAAKRWLHINTTGGMSRVRIVNMSMPRPQDANGVIYIEAVGSGTGGNVITGNSFPRTTNTHPYITSDDADARGFAIYGNSFERDGSNDYLEDAGATSSVDGNFSDSTFGPNNPAYVVEYNITGSNNVFFPTSADINPGGSGHSPIEPHAILDGDVHTDTLAGTVVRGDVPVGNSTPAWARLPLGADHRFLGSDGSDAVYRNIGYDAILAPSGTNDHTVIQASIDAGDKRILLLDGTWDIGGNVTFASGVEILGQSRAGTILDFGSAGFSFLMGTGDTFLGNLGLINGIATGLNPAIQMNAGTPAIWNIDFGTTSGNGVYVQTGGPSRIMSCLFRGVPDAATGQIIIDDPKDLLIVGCGFKGTAGAGASIANWHLDIGGAFDPPPNIVVSNCYGRTALQGGWFLDVSARVSSVTLVGNGIGAANEGPSVDNRSIGGLGLAVIVIEGNSFVVAAGAATGAAMIDVSGGTVIIGNNHLQCNSARTAGIRLQTGGHSVHGNLIRAAITNAIHLDTGNNNVISGNKCPSGDIRVAAGSTGNIVALNIVNAVVGDTVLNEIGMNVTGA